MPQTQVTRRLAGPAPHQAGDDELAAGVHPRGRLRRVDVRSHFRDASALDCEGQGACRSGGIDDPSALGQYVVGHGFLRAASVDARGLNRRRRYPPPALA